MNIAITGVSGLLGAHLAAALSSRHRVVGFDRHAWWGTKSIELRQGDLAKREDRENFLRDAEPDVLFHCAAMVNVDICEERQADAYFSNGTLTGLLAREVPSGCRIVYITTDGIFRGETPMQRETDLPCPRTVYGRSKLQGEWEVQLAGNLHQIIRTNFFGWSSGAKSTSGEWLYGALKTGDPITLFDDFWFTPIYVVDLVDSILRLAARGPGGIFHVTGRDRITKYDFGLQLAAVAGFSSARVARGSIENAHLRAPRPRDMSLNADKVAEILGRPAPGSDEGLARFLKDRQKSLEDRVAHLHGILSV